METTAPSARERILTTAHDLFYRDGIRATGVDRLIAESGVAKLTFYRHFASKDDLVRAFLDYRHARWMAWFVDALGRHGASEGLGLQPLVGAMEEWFRDPAFRGCAFINSVVEVGASVQGAADTARRHKHEMEQVIAELLPPELQGTARAARAQAVGVALDGAVLRAQMGDVEGALAALRGLL
ncbi:TetR/AcrR family transcriptional regulator [Pseudorhodoferax sp. Leaf274]|uniref:TetR/AcrR family transcriptional regulator n=1 Tax=Pseudorhodoferax sp. Leaf274 TaxID=1736318 RepID=UPI0007024135|nr:TetR/AcrR family transcriptional regulator [Pseudorhodoferax sp. Leaf274]KQP38068.1 TetR family transcriptional regulator [Pseudorhodoferax sp. Leaf274]